MKVRNDSKIIIKSQDLNAELLADDLSEALSAKGDFGLIQSILHVVQPKYGFELYLNSDFPWDQVLVGQQLTQQQYLDVLIYLGKINGISMS